MHHFQHKRDTDFRKMFQDIFTTQISFYSNVSMLSFRCAFYSIKCTPKSCLSSYKTHWINLMLDKIMLGVGQESVTMDTVQIMIFPVTLVRTYERTILLSIFHMNCFCVVILNSVMEHSTVLLILSLYAVFNLTCSNS